MMTKLKCLSFTVSSFAITFARRSPASPTFMRDMEGKSVNNLPAIDSSGLEAPTPAAVLSPTTRTVYEDAPFSCEKVFDHSVISALPRMRQNNCAPSMRISARHAMIMKVKIFIAFDQVSYVFRRFFCLTHEHLFVFREAVFFRLLFLP